MGDSPAAEVGNHLAAGNIVVVVLVGHHMSGRKRSSAMMRERLRTFIDDVQRVTDLWISVLLLWTIVVTCRGTLLCHCCGELQ